MYRVLSLFAGIGGFDLGLERTGGFRTVAFCEIDPFCRKVLAKHWPSVPCYEDVRTLTAERLASDGIAVDAIVGGFPCQDISFAGRGAGLAGERSGLWYEFARLVGELRPSLVILENVAALLARGLDAVLGTLASLGYDAQWHCIPAAAVGAPHIRDRLWGVAYPQHPNADRSGPYRAGELIGGNAESADKQIRLARSLGALLADARREHGDRRAHIRAWNRQPDRARLEDGQEATGAAERSGEDVADASLPRLQAPQQEVVCRTGRRQEGRTASERGWWRSEPDVGRVAHGVPARVDRLRSLGNAVVPQIPEMIGRAILAADQERIAA